MTNHNYFSFQERKYQVITLSLLVGKIEFFILGSNVNEGFLFIKVGYTKRTRLKMKQSELGCFIHLDESERK